MMRRALVVALAALAAACATPLSQRYPAGTNSSAVIQGLGPPTAEHRAAAGGRRLEYAGGAFGRTTWMFDFDASDRLVSAEQVRDEAHFDAIKAGMSAGEVRTQIGAPSTTWPIAWQRQLVWSYRYETPFCQWFMVGMGTEGKVVDTAYGPDPLCERDEFFHFRMRR
jgi:hypothetical protein